MQPTLTRTRWAAIGAAVAVTLGAGGIGIGHATVGSGDKPVLIDIEPCRLADTRPAPDTVGPRSGPIGPDETYTLDGWGQVGNCTLPSGTSALALNVTAVVATEQSNLRFFPAGGKVPTAANLNPTPGAPPTPNAVTVGLSDTNGKFSVFNKHGSVAVVIDVVGYYDDHTHDDRYHTEAEVDAMMPLFGTIFQNGSIAVNGRGIVAVGHPATGRYSITFDREVNTCSAFATDAFFDTAIDASADTQVDGPDQARVVVRDHNNAFVDTYFSIMVLC